MTPSDRQTETPRKRQRILVVDDEETLCEALRFNLTEAGYDVDVAFSAEQALTMELSSYSLIILDIMMGHISGLQFAEIIRDRVSTARTPIIFCSALGEDNDMIRGLEAGADDYMAKPFSIRHLLARVKAVLRRTDNHDDAVTPGVPESDPGVLRFKGLCVMTQSKHCIVDGKEITMPKKEFEILQLLLSHPGRIFSRSEILHRIWPESVVVLDRVVDVNITRLRQKISPYEQHIVTRSGYGYGFYA